MSELIVSNISKKFGDRYALKDLSFSVKNGSVFCLLGGNGAGKSTTLQILLGTLKPDEGSFSLAGNDSLNTQSSLREKIFYLPDLISLYPEFNAIENLEYLTLLSGTAADTNQIKEALAEVSLPKEYHTTTVKLFSKGMAQKVMLALARLKKAELLLLDEPTTGLDPSAINEFVNLIQSLKSRGAIVVMVTHDLQCARLLSDEIGILQSGSLVNRTTNQNLTTEDLEKVYFSTVN